MATVEEAREAARKARAARAAKEAAAKLAVPESKLRIQRPPDPGRPQLAVEWMTTVGEAVLRLPMQCSDDWLQVDAFPTAGLDIRPLGAAGCAQEWRVLRFGTGGNIVQSVAKVWVSPCRDEQKSEHDKCRDDSVNISLAAVLPFPYTRTFVTLATAALWALRAPSCSMATFRLDQIRILCIGLGGGSIPTYLVDAFPNAHVDVAELEPAVLEAAKQAMGFRESRRLCVTIQDGANFALNAASSVDRGIGYDVVLVDAMDGDGVIPPSLVRPCGGLVRALSRGLLRDQGGVVAINTFHNSDPGLVIQTYNCALVERMVESGLGLSCAAVAEATNNIIAMTTCGPCHKPVQTIAELHERLRDAAQEFGEATQCPFDMAALLDRNLYLV